MPFYRRLTEINMYDYVFLSPIFNSISKKEYFSKFNDEILLNASLNGKINKKVIALGGINQETLPIVKKYGFWGVAVIGSVWETAEIVTNFLNLKLLL